MKFAGVEIGDDIIVPAGVDNEVVVNDNTDPWAGALLEQRRNTENIARANRAAYSRSMFEDLGAIIKADKDAAAKRRMDMDDALACAYIYAKGNDGFAPPAILPSLSKTLGFNCGGAMVDDKGNMYVYERGDDGKLMTRGIADKRMMWDVFDRSQMGFDERAQMYRDWREKYTENQLADMGVVNPANRTIGGGTISGNVASLIGMGGPQRRGISAFSADGRGNFSQTYSGPETNWMTVRHSYGKDADNPNGRWKLLRIGYGDALDENGKPIRGKVYTNSKTGEDVFVRDGSSLRETLNGMSEKAQIAKHAANEKLAISQMNNNAQMERLREQESGRDARAKARNESREEIEAARDARLREAEWNRYANRMRDAGKTEEEIVASLGQKPSVGSSEGTAQSGSSKADGIVGAKTSTGQATENGSPKNAGATVSKSGDSKYTGESNVSSAKVEVTTSPFPNGKIAIYEKGANGRTIGTFKPGEPINMNGETFYWGGKGQDDLYTEQEWKVERTKEAARKIIEERKRKAASGANDKNPVVANGDDPMWGEGDGEKKKTAVQLRQENATGYDKNKKTVEAKARDTAMESAFQDYFKRMKDAGMIEPYVTEEGERKRYFDAENKRRRIKEGIRKELMSGIGDRRTGL